MNRFFLAKEQVNGKEVAFPSDICHQILHVLRLREGDEVRVLDNQGSAHLVRLQFDRESNRVRGKIIATKPVSTEPSAIISLCFGMTNRDKVELILQKATEVGVSAFYPFISSRTLVQRTTLSDKKFERWQRIIREAAEQSQRGRLPHLHRTMDFVECVRVVDDHYARKLVAWERAEDSQNKRLSSMRINQGESLALFIGPEGGFSKEEIQILQDSGGEVVSLGKRILRMETAAIVFPALVLNKLGEM